MNGLKICQQWEAWAKRMEQKMERLARDQEGEFQKWAQQYEKSWERLGDQLESSEVDPEVIGELVEQNLKMLSELPLGKLVDQALQDGLGELSTAPWESLDELGALAEKALDRRLHDQSDPKPSATRSRSDQPRYAGPTTSAIGRKNSRD